MKKFSKKGLSLLILGLVLPLALHADIEIKIIKSEQDLPERFCSIWQKGDFVVTDGRTLILIGGVPRSLKSTGGNYPAPNAMGSILSIVPAGKNLQSAMNIGAGQVRIKDKTDYATYTTVNPGPKNPIDGSLSIECTGIYENTDKARAEIKTTYQVMPGAGKVLLSSTIKNIGTAEIKDLSYSLYFGANHSYSFSPFNRTSFPKLNFRVYPKKGHYLGWLNPNPLEEGDKRLPGKLAPGETYKVQYSLYAEAQPNALLETIYQGLNVKASPAMLHFKNVEGRFMEVVVRETLTSTIFFRTFLEEPFSITVPLPDGLYSVRANFFPAQRETVFAVKPNAENLAILENPNHGSVRLKIKNSKGEFVPGKVTFIGLDPTKSPYFRPENPRDTSRGWETFKNSCYPPEEGLEVRLPVGNYLVYAARGPEYTRDQKIIEILKDDRQDLLFTIDKVVETPNLISLDPHMHTQNSDGQVLVPERLKSVVAEGVDVAVATDHNTITDYAGPLKKLGLNKYLAVIFGSEVTKPSHIHYNTYPLQYKANEDDHGAIDIDADDVTVLFNASRTADPLALLQLNHPRAGDLGYFNNYQLDKDSAAFAKKKIDMSFSLFEAMNGPTFFRGNQEAIEDWLHLLNRGYYFPIVGSSDAHGIDGAEPGYSRTYISYAGGKGDALDAAAFFQALKKGKSFVSNGPIVDFKVNAAYAPGDTLKAKAGKVDISLRVTSAPWVSVDEVRLIVNGERRIIFPIKPAEKSAVKFRQQFSFNLEKDATLVVEVLGKKTLYPVVERLTADGLPVNASLPYALTNPVFVDVDGNGRFDPPWPDKVKIQAEPAATKRP